jgi:hypothetical protein
MKSSLAFTLALQQACQSSAWTITDIDIQSVPGETTYYVMLELFNTDTFASVDYDGDAQILQHMIDHENWSALLRELTKNTK